MRVVVSNSAATDAYVATADSDGQWRVRIGPYPAGGPYRVEATAGTARVSADDIVFGDVWLCSGQSNMARPVSYALDAAAEIAAATHPDLRLMTVPDVCAREPLQSPQYRQRRDAGCELTAAAPPTWMVASPASVADFSAVCYFFGRSLLDAGVPIGLLDASWPSTPIETWIRREAAASRMAEFTDAASSVAAAEALSNRSLGTVYNGMIAPLGGYGLRGVVWYQGESNAIRVAPEPHRYESLLSTLVDDWRAQFGAVELKIVQISTSGVVQELADEDSSWAFVRESQAEVARTKVKTSLVVTTDLGSIERIRGYAVANLHPFNKQDVGRRLAPGQPSPTFERVTRETMTSLRVTFRGAGSGLMTGTKAGLGRVQPTDAPVVGFAVSDRDQHWHWADATIDGETVVVSAPAVVPVAVRYCWGNSPTCNLYSRSGLPAAPFRTDRSWAVSVSNGTAGGARRAVHSARDLVSLVADPPPAGLRFDRWTGDVAHVTDPRSATTTLVMPAKYVSLHASFVR